MTLSLPILRETRVHVGWSQYQFLYMVDLGIHLTVAAYNFSADINNYTPGRVKVVNTVGAVDTNNVKG